MAGSARRTASTRSRRPLLPPPPPWRRGEQTAGRSCDGSRGGLQLQQAAWAWLSLSLSLSRGRGRRFLVDEAADEEPVQDRERLGRRDRRAAAPVDRDLLGRVGAGRQQAS